MEHNHEHTHEHDCCCHSHEHHEHEHCSCGHSHEGVHVDIHEGALVGSLIKTSKEPYTQLKKCFEKEIISLRDQVKDENGHIGHIKGFIKCGNSTCAFSTTGAEITIIEKEENTADESELNIVCIVFGIDKEKLACMLADIAF